MRVRVQLDRQSRRWSWTSAPAEDSPSERSPTEFSTAHRVFDGAGSDPRRTGAVRSGSVGNYMRGACGACSACSACTHRTHLYLQVAGLEVMVNRCISEGRFTDGAIPRVVAQFVDGPA